MDQPNNQPPAETLQFVPPPGVQASAASPSIAMDLVGQLLDNGTGQPVQPVQPVQLQPQPQLRQPPQPQLQPQLRQPHQPQLQQPPQPQPQPQLQQPPQPQPQPPVTGDVLADRFSSEPPQVRDQPIPDIPQEQQIAIPQNTPENIGHAFAASRAETRQYRQLAESLRQQLESERAKRGEFSAKETELSQKLVAAENRNKELEDKLGQLDLSQSREFREKYDAPINGVQDAISDALVSAGHQKNDADNLAVQILGAQDPTDLLRELPPTVQGMIMYKVQEANNLFAQRDQALNDWRTTQAGLASVSVRDSAVVDATHRAEVADAAVAKARTIAPTMMWDDLEYIPRRDDAIAKAKAWYQHAPEDQIAAAAIEGFMAPFAYEVIDHLSEQVAQLRDALNGRRSLGAPPVSPSYVPPPPPPPPPPPGAAAAWSPADNPADMNAAALGFVSNLVNRS